MSRFKVVITDCTFTDLRIQEEILNPIGARLERHHCKGPEEVLAVGQDADAILNGYCRIPGSVIEQLERCKVIVRYGIGVDSVDLAAATKKGICVANIPDYCLDEVAFHAVAMLLSCVRKLHEYHAQLSGGQWSEYQIAAPLHRPSQVTLGIVGFGRIGRRVAELVSGFGWQVLAFDPFLQPEQIQAGGAEPVSFEELLARSDAITIHSPLTDDTRGLFGRETIGKMKRGAGLVNVARGPIVQGEALLEALDSGQLSAAGLDVFEQEPPQETRLLTHPRIVCTPHVAWYSEQALEDNQRKAAEQVVEVLTGGWPRHLVNREVKRILQSRR